MNIGEIFKTKRWKTFMGYVYGWGASVVMIGDLFKLRHWQYTGLLLTIGLTTEALIFFLSAFEPPLEMPEWSKVYPELRDDYDFIETDEFSRRGKNGFEQLFSSSEVSPELLEKVGKSLNDLSNTARGISDTTTATMATDMYVQNLRSASETINAFTEINKKANESVNSSVEKLIRSYSEASQQLSETGKTAIENLNISSKEFSVQLAESGKKLFETVNGASHSVSNELKNIGENSKIYSQNLETLNQNINALNEGLKTQLEGTRHQFEANRKFNDDITKMNDILTSSISELEKYKQNAERLNQQLESLNTIYANMLGALSYKK